MRKRIISITAIVLFCAVISGMLYSCETEPSDTESGTRDNTVRITIDGTTLNASLNKDDLSEVMMFDRKFVTESVELSDAHADRDVYLVESSVLSGATVYEISGNSTDKSYNTIPVNGFLLSVAKGTLNIKNGVRLTVEGYESPTAETEKYCIMRLGGTKRRVYLRDPETIPDDEIIVFITDATESDTPIPASYSAYALNKSANSVFSVGEKLTGVIPAGSFAMMFGGDYNRAYSAYYMKGNETLNLTRMSMLFSDSYKSGIDIGGEKIELSASVNSAPGADGVYIYDSAYDSVTTPDFQSESAAVIVSEGKAVFLGGKDVNVIIPTGSSFAVVFAGESMKYYNSLSLGDPIDAILTDISATKPDDGIELNYTLGSVGYTLYNDTRYTDYLVIYDRSGATTGTNIYGFEIAVNSEGKMCAESHYGNMTVPTGGFVLSGHGTSQDALEKMYTYGAQVEIDKTKKTVYVLTTPLTRTESIREEYELLEARYNDTLASYADFDYKTVSTSLDSARELLDSINTKVDTGDYAGAIGSLSSVSKLLDEAKFLIFTDEAAENRAAWYAPTETNDAAVEKTVALMKKMHLNTLYIETWRNGETIYPTSVGWTRETPGFNGFDVLGAFVRECHKNNIEVHCWVHNFFIGTTAQLTNSEHIVANTTQYHLITRSGTPYNPTPEYGNFVFLDPYTKVCRDFLLELYAEMLDNYDIDGIHLDYTRFPEPNDYSNSKRDDFGYNEDIVKAFMQSQNTSIDPHDIYPGHSLWNAWCKFREEIINSFVREVYELVKSKDTNTWVSCAVFPDLETAPYTIFQNVKNWVDSGYMDEVFAMAYSSSVDYIVENTNDFMRVVNGQSFYSVGLGAFQSYGEYVYLTQVQATRALGVDGTAIFSLGSVNNNTLCNYLSDTVHRKEAVRTYELEKTLSAQLASLIARCDGIFGESGASRSELDALKASFTEIKNFSDGFNSDNATAEQKLAFISSALEKLNAVSVPATDADFAKALKAEIEKCTGCLERSEYRIRVNCGIDK